MKKNFILISIITAFVFLFTLTSCVKSKKTNTTTTGVEPTTTVTPTITLTPTSTVTPTETQTTPISTTTNVITTTVNDVFYDISFVDDNDNELTTLKVKEGQMPVYNEIPAKEEDDTYTYEFTGWDSDLVKAEADKTYKATFKAVFKEYTISFIDDNNNEISSAKYHFGEEVLPPTDPTRVSDEQYDYTFAGWDSEVVSVTGTKTYKATYAQTTRKYTITFVDYDGTILSSSNVEYGKMPTTPTTPTRVSDEQYDYTFAGWDSEVVSVTGTKTYKATYTQTTRKYTITINNQVVGLTINGITSGNEYDYDSQVTLSASNIPSGVTILWSRSDGVEYVGDAYSFNVPAKNITITTTTKLPYTRNGNKIYFGTYPQTKLDETKYADKIESLNSKAGDLPTSTDKGQWIDYNYYYSSTIMSYMYYQDIDYDNNGTYDFRGVYFTRLRPIYYYNVGTSNNSSQDDNGYKINKIYWFSYDPIEWDILSEENGQVLILANLLLDSQEYYPSEETSKFLHNEAEVYANNYAFSSVRKWLNDNFYETAFSTLEKAIIQTTMVNNLPSSTSSSSSTYTCANTYDKMFLLSYQEAPKKVYYDDLVGQAQGTDYAKCQGLQVITSGSYAGNSYWYLRSPSYNYANYAYCVSYDGTIYVDYYVYSSSVGVRPACWIKL